MIPAAPTRADATTAAETLYAAIDTFPFLTDADSAAAIAAMLTAQQRRILPAAPIITINASTPGTGKTLFAKVISAYATGRGAAAMSPGKDPAELEKRIDGVLLDADPIVLVDNIDFPVRSETLCIVSTEPTKAVRVLGGSRVSVVPTNATFCLTGNNLTLLGDLTRRVVMIRMDAGCERPEQRAFRRDAVQHVLDHRDALIAAGLTLMRAYQVAGSPDVETRPYGSFGLWDLMIRRAIVWSGFPGDPLEPAADLREEDHEYIGMRDLFVVWWELFESEPVTAADLIARARATVPLMGSGYDLETPALAGAVASIIGDSPRVGARELGYRLRAWQGRILGGFRLVRDRTRSKGGVRYRLEAGQ